MIEEKDIKVGDKIEYGPFSNITFTGFKDGMACMVDKNGNEKEVYKSLFLKHAKIIKED